jgi:hypothetical protein
MRKRKTPIPSEGELKRRYSALLRSTTTKKAGPILATRCEIEDWKCHAKNLDQSLAYPLNEVEQQINRIKGWKPGSNLSVTEQQLIKGIPYKLHQFIKQLNEVKKKVEVWFQRHPDRKVYKDEKQYQLQYLNWICRGLTGTALVGPGFTFKGPLGNLLTWYLELNQYCKNEKLAEALNKWWSEDSAAPTTDFFLIWSRIFFRKSWCEQQLKGVLALLTVAEYYSKDLLDQRKSHLSHIHCHNAIRQFIQTLERYCNLKN